MQMAIVNAASTAVQIAEATHCSLIRRLCLRLSLILRGFLLGAIEVAMLVLLPQEYGGMKDAFVFGIIALVLVWRPDGILSPPTEKGDKI